MRPRSLLLIIALSLILLSKPARAESYEDGYAAYGRGDYATAFHIWKRLADEGRHSAQYGLGELYSLGLGVPRDDVEAAKWNRMAAESGYVPAQSRLGAMYDEGRGIPKSLPKAMKWYRKAAQQGDLPAQISLGLIYVTGRGVPQNYFQALIWFRLAAEQGNALAQFNLGLIYAGGYDVVPKDNVQALVWFILASQGGNKEARKYREAFATRLNPKLKEKAEKLAQDWVTTKAQDKAIKCSMVGATECK